MRRRCAIGELMPGGAVGRVLESTDPKFQVGGIVQGMLGWQEYAVVDAGGLRAIDESLAPIQTALGVLGMPGLTAYFGLLDVCHPKAGQTVVVSGAAGAVGMLVGQLARIMGCRVVGVAGSDAKVAFLVNELGFDGAFNYKTTTDYYGQLKALCPAGIDVYFDNVGGDVSDAVMRLINAKARISICGQISQYNLEKPELGPRWFGRLLVKRAKAQGFLVSDYSHRFAEGLQGMGQWLRQGKLKYREDVVQGLENSPRLSSGCCREEISGNSWSRFRSGQLDPQRTRTKGVEMSVAKVSEISATSSKSFEDALQLGLARANKTLRNVKAAWVKEQQVHVSKGAITEYQVNMMVTFVLDD